MWKRILALVTFTLALALTLSLLVNLITEVKAEENENILEFIEAQPVFEEIHVTQKFETVLKETKVEETILEETIAVETKQEEEMNDIIEYKGHQYKIPHIILNRQPRVTENGYKEKYTEVPHYFQSYYPDVRYGDSNIRKSGCGIACVSMVLTYLLDKEVPIEELAKKYFSYKVNGGSTYNLFPDSAEDYGVTIEKQAWNWEEVKTALENGQVVIATANSKSIFTDGGHYIVLSGLTEDGKILIRDPNLYNYSIFNYPVREEGYANGFDEKSVMYNCFPMWIYAPKDLEAVAARNTK